MRLILVSLLDLQPINFSRKTVLFCLSRFSYLYFFPGRETSSLHDKLWNNLRHVLSHKNVETKKAT